MQNRKLEIIKLWKERQSSTCFKAKCNERAKNFDLKGFYCSLNLDNFNLNYLYKRLFQLSLKLRFIMTCHKAFDFYNSNYIPFPQVFFCSKKGRDREKKEQTLIHNKDMLISYSYTQALLYCGKHSIWIHYSDGLKSL